MFRFFSKASFAKNTLIVCSMLLIGACGDIAVRASGEVPIASHSQRIDSVEELTPSELQDCCGDCAAANRTDGLPFSADALCCEGRCDRSDFDACDATENTLLSCTNCCMARNNQCWVGRNDLEAHGECHQPHQQCLWACRDADFSTPPEDPNGPSDPSDPTDTPDADDEPSGPTAPPATEEEEEDGHSMDVQLRFSLFIPYVGVTITALPMIHSTDLACALGDGRGFSYDSPNYRARMTLDLHFPASEEGEPLISLRQRRFGVSKIWLPGEI